MTLKIHIFPNVFGIPFYIPGHCDKQKIVNFMTYKSKYAIRKTCFESHLCFTYEI